MIDLAVDALAVHRLTRLVTADTITQPLRARIIARAYLAVKDRPIPNVFDMDDAQLDNLPHADDDAPKLAALVVCPWCVSIYTATVVVLARRYLPRQWTPIATGLALSTVAALLSRTDNT